MDVSAISQLIGSLGFPIVCCSYMMVTNNKTIKELTAAVQQLTTAVNILINKESSDIHAEGLSYVKDDAD